MADSDLLRQQRHQKHARGDHSLCRPARCVYAQAAGVTEVPEPEVDVSDGLGPAVAQYVSSLGFPADDPRSLSGQIAIKLATAFDRSGSVAAIREARVIMGQISDVPLAEPTGLDVLRLRRHERRLDMLLQSAENGH